MTNIILTIFLSTQTADITTTCYAISTGKMHETNRILGDSCIRIAATKVTVDSAIALTAAKLKKNHSKLSKLVLISSVAATSAGIVNNIYQIGKR